MCGIADEGISSVGSRLGIVEPPELYEGGQPCYLKEIVGDQVDHA